MSQHGAGRLATIRNRWTDGLVAVVVATAFQAEIWLLGDPTLRRPSVAVLALAMSLPLAIRRYAPLLTVTIIATAYMALLRVAPLVVDEYFMIVIIILLTAYTAGHQPDLVRAVVGGLIILAASWFEVVLDDPGALTDYVFITLIIGAAWTAGLGMKQRERRTSQLEEEAVTLREERDAAAEQAATEERARIARELHDIISHNVSVMVLQAGAAGEVIDINPSGAKASLSAIQLTGRQALVELRRLLGVLGTEDCHVSTSPQPGLGQLPSLIETLRTTGLTVELHVLGTPVSLPPGVDVSAYRIVQEALTNVARHAGPAKVAVTVTYREGAVTIEVVDTGRGSTVPVAAGRGLVGMRERVSLHGGTFEAGPASAGGFEVRVWLPLTGGTP